MQSVWHASWKPDSERNLPASMRPLARHWCGISCGDRCVHHGPEQPSPACAHAARGRELRIRPLDSSQKAQSRVSPRQRTCLSQGTCFASERHSTLNSRPQRGDLARLEGDALRISLRSVGDVVVQDESVTLGSAGTGRVNIYAAYEACSYCRQNV